MPGAAAGETPASFASRTAALNGPSAREFCLDFGTTFQKVIRGEKHRYVDRGEVLIRGGLRRQATRSVLAASLRISRPRQCRLGSHHSDAPSGRSPPSRLAPRTASRSRSSFATSRPDASQMPYREF
jgi:hypothetical protein